MNLNPFFKNVVALVFCCFLSFLTVNAAIDNKPKLEFEAKINPTNHTIEITWATCLENTVLTVLDINERPLKSFSLCKDNTIIDIADLTKGTYWVKVEHYTAFGIQQIVLE